MEVVILWTSPFGDKYKVGDVLDHPKAIRLVNYGIAAPRNKNVSVDEAKRAEMFSRIVGSYHVKEDEYDDETDDETIDESDN